MAVGFVGVGGFVLRFPWSWVVSWVGDGFACVASLWRSVSLIDSSAAKTLAEILERRGDPMAACREVEWLAPFVEVPADAAVPLAMSPLHPRAVGSYGAECIDWMRADLGVSPRWWQALAITRQLEHDADGVLVHREIVETGPRRIGKSVRLRGVALWRTGRAGLIGERQLSMLVSKDLAVGKEIHRGAWRWAEQKGWKVTRLNGGQEVEAPDESRWLLRADSAVYGYDVGYGQVDEAWGVDPMSITDGLEPALLERLWAQLHLTGTAHVKATSLMRRRLTAALRQADDDVLLLMWGAHPEADVGDEGTWRAASAHWSEDRRALIGRKYAAALAGQDEPEFDDPDPVRGWAAQYLNVWPLLVGASADSLWPNWDSLASKVDPGDPMAIAIASDIAQTWLSLGASSFVGDVPFVGAALREPAVNRIAFIEEVSRIQQTYDCSVVVDVKGPASFLVDDLELAGVALTRVGLDEFVHSTSDFNSAVESGRLLHGDHSELNAAVGSAGWRSVGDRRVFGRKSGDISMLEAAALAMYGAKEHEVDPSAYFI